MPRPRQIFRPRITDRSPSRIVVARSDALIPVVVPRRASIDSQNGVPKAEVFFGDIIVKSQRVAALLGQRQTNQSAPKLRHEIDHFRRHFLRRHGQIAFILAILVIHQHNHPPLANFLHSLFHRRKWSIVRSLIITAISHIGTNDRNIAPINPAPGIVRTQAHTIRRVTPQRTAETAAMTPTPAIAPVITCVVLTGIPACAVPISVIAAEVSAANPPNGFSLVILWPMVFTTRQPPAIVPPAIAR